MIAEFANHHSWIAWVPIVSPFVAGALVFRRMPTVPLAILGGLAGLALGACAPLIGIRDDWVMVQLCLSIAGSVVGGVWGSSIGARLRRRGPRDPDGSLVTIALAVGLGLAGLLAGALAPAMLQGRAPDMDIDVIVSSALGGGLGWCLGSAIGWHRSRERARPTTAQRRLLVVMAGTIALLGIAIGTQISAARFGPSIDEIRWDDPRLPPTAMLVYLDTAVAAFTLLALAQRRSGRAPRSHAVSVPRATGS